MINFIRITAEMETLHIIIATPEEAPDSNVKQHD